jgi:hypothetical protein
VAARQSHGTLTIHRDEHEDTMTTTSWLVFARIAIIVVSLQP